MSRQDKKTLTERQELLLSRYFDGECGFLSRYSAESLLKRKHEARAFFAQLSSISEECHGAYAHNAGRDADLWNRISVRIESEERAALYLGNRREEPRLARSGFMERIYNPQVVMGGLSGAALAALALVFVTRTTSPTEILTVARGGLASPSISSGVTQVGLGSGINRLPTDSSARRRASASTMEVDWMRANGPLALIQNPHGKSAIIWVRRKPGSGMRNARQPVSAVPTIQRMLEQGLDESPLNQSK